ncbi:methyltransferase domain-containing protein [Zobellella sp. An-6]|uniref:methyltransferase domain-containing protein n=1 Tax=Zobellella sp. An-6 TaxID=3400218 RepID=UPI0040430358
MQYQSFPDVRGGSESLQKLSSLRLPPLAGKRFLDVGCNEGFFCGYALFDGAARVVGIDKSAEALSRARLRFAAAEFLNQSWDCLPEGPFDVITLLSALHYAEDQAELIHRLMERLSDNGLLVLEISMAPGHQDEWIKVKRAIDERYFPTRIKLGKVLKDYAWKVIGHSVNQAGDPLQRYVVHVRRLKPYAWLLMQQPGTGKSTISRRIFSGKPQVPVVSGDRTYLQITQGKFDISAGLREAVSQGFTTATIDKTTRRVLEQGLMAELVEVWTRQAGYRDFILDSYVPAEFHQQVRNQLHALGYFPVDISWETPSPLIKARDAIDKANSYEAHLKKTVVEATAGRISIRKLLKPQLKSLVRWHLDSPTPGQLHADSNALRLSGWALGSERYQTCYQVYVSGPRGRLLFSPRKVRQDVLTALFGQEQTAPAFWRTTPCGFSFELPAAWLEDAFELGVQFNGEQVPLARVSTESAGSSPGFGTQLLRSLKRYSGN